MPFDGKSIEANSPVITLLREARGRLEQGFCHKALKLYRIGEQKYEYCALGAVIDNSSWFLVKPTDLIKEAVVYIYKGMGKPLPIERAAGEVVPYAVAVVDWNNSHNKEEVLAAFDKAIELATADALVTA